MPPQDSVDIPPVRQIGHPRQSPLIPVDEHLPGAKSVITPRQIYGLMAYYMALLVGCIAVIFLLVWEDGPLLKEKVAEELLFKKLLFSMTFLISGAIVGSVLYQIRTLFRSYIKIGDFDSRWLPKYISAPVEAAGLALAIISLIQGGAIVLGGQSFDFSNGKPFAAFGIGALIGFGIREVVGWLGTVSRTVFPTDKPVTQSSEANQRKRGATKQEIEEWAAVS
jgi:hypothetical protein